MASKSRRNKTKFKWTKELSFLVAFIAVILTATIILTIFSGAGLGNKLNTIISDYNTANSTSYSSLSKDDNCFEEVSAFNYDGVVSKVESISKSDDYTFFWYGTTTDGTYLENLSAIDTAAQTYNVKKVYLFYSTYYQDAVKNDETSSITYKKKIDEYEKKLNSKEAESAVVDFDMNVENTLLVYKAGKLVFNSQNGNSSSEYTIAMYINRALSMGAKDREEKK